MGKHRSTDLKQAVVDYYMRMKSLSETSTAFRIPEETIRRWVKRYNETGNIDYHYRGSMSYKVEQQHFDHIKQHITKNKDIYLHEVRDDMKNNFPDLDISVMHLSRVIKDIPYSRKLWTRKHYPETRYGVALNFDKDKSEFFRKLRRFTIDDMIAVDETSIQM